MNVDILENNPRWWWYPVFMIGTPGLTIVVWIIFRKFPNVSVVAIRAARRSMLTKTRQLEHRLDDRFSSLKPQAAERNGKDLESGRSSQRKKVSRCEGTVVCQFNVMRSMSATFFRLVTPAARISDASEQAFCWPRTIRLDRRCW
jgi:hypothetical protein